MLEIVIYIVLAIVAISAIKIAFSFKFDYVEWKKMRDKKAKLRLQNLCPHATAGIRASGETYLDMALESPPGREDFICRMCGVRGWHAKRVKDLMEYWSKNIDEFIKASKKYQKEAEKYLK